MFIYHSKPATVRVTVVGNVSDGELLISVARCSGKDSFRKRTEVIPARAAFDVQTSKGKVVVPERPEEIHVGGVDLALERLDEGCVYISYPLPNCTVKQFNTIAKGIVAEVMNNPELVEKCKMKNE